MNWPFHKQFQEKTWCLEAQGGCVLHSRFHSAKCRAGSPNLSTRKVPNSIWGFTSIWLYCPDLRETPSPLSLSKSTHWCQNSQDAEPLMLMSQRFIALLFCPFSLESSFLCRPLRRGKNCLICGSVSVDSSPVKQAEKVLWPEGLSSQTHCTHVSLLQHRSNGSMNKPCKAPDVHTARNFAYSVSRNMACKVEGNLVPGALALLLQGTVLWRLTWLLVTVRECQALERGFFQLTEESNWDKTLLKARHSHWWAVKSLLNSRAAALCTENENCSNQHYSYKRLPETSRLMWFHLVCQGKKPATLSNSINLEQYNCYCCEGDPAYIGSRSWF